MGRQHSLEIKGAYEAEARDKSEAEKWKKKYEVLEARNQKQNIYFKQEIMKLNRELET